MSLEPVGKVKHALETKGDCGSEGFTDEYSISD